MLQEETGGNANTIAVDTCFRRYEEAMNVEEENEVVDWLRRALEMPVIRISNAFCFHRNMETGSSKTARNN